MMKGRTTKMLVLAFVLVWIGVIALLTHHTSPNAHKEQFHRHVRVKNDDDTLLEDDRALDELRDAELQAAEEYMNEVGNEGKIKEDVDTAGDVDDDRVQVNNKENVDTAAVGDDDDDRVQVNDKNMINKKVDKNINSNSLNIKANDKPSMLDILENVKKSEELGKVVDGFDVEHHHHILHPKSEWVSLPRPPKPSVPRMKFVNEIESRRSDNAYQMNNFNVMESDKLPSDRPVTDTRPRGCLKLSYPSVSELPHTSIIITFHNEARSTLYRTVRSVLDRSPAELIDEIILIDDFSDDPEQGKIVEGMEKVRILRNSAREGLIRSRVRGANAAQSDVLTFLDSHVECNVGWLEPILARFAENYRTVVCPTIDVINKDNFKYLGTTPGLRGGFSWSMQFQWETAPRTDSPSFATDPTLTPMIAGGLFSITKRWFDESGQYDLEMDVWGGENFEISFRTWMCGGKMEILPCSRVGHVFRSSHPYKFPGGSSNTYDKNVARVAEVWMDEFKEHVHHARPSTKFVQFGPVEERKALREKLQCGLFKDYLGNVYPELSVPGRDTYGSGQIKQGNICLQADARGGAHVVMAHCLPSDSDKQEFVFRKDGTIKLLDGHGGNFCVFVDEQNRLLMTYCDSNSVRQQFVYSSSKSIASKATQTCFDTSGKEGNVALATCTQQPLQNKRFFFTK
eukprot:m.72228 g.72228  ORF g.72228 m.72228 type:complete len:683 (+) comp8373_c0_seq1:49-2097(+)